MKQNNKVKGHITPDGNAVYDTVNVSEDRQNMAAVQTN